MQRTQRFLFKVYKSLFKIFKSQILNHLKINPIYNKFIPKIQLFLFSIYSSSNISQMNRFLLKIHSSNTLIKISNRTQPSKMQRSLIKMYQMKYQHNSLDSNLKRLQKHLIKFCMSSSRHQYRMSKSSRLQLRVFSLLCNKPLNKNRQRSNPKISNIKSSINSPQRVVYKLLCNKLSRRSLMSLNRQINHLIFNYSLLLSNLLPSKLTLINNNNRPISNLYLNNKRQLILVSYQTCSCKILICMTAMQNKLILRN